MKLYSQALELRAIRTIAVKNGFQDDESAATALATNGAVMASSLVLASIDQSFFHYEPCKAAYARLVKIAEKRSRILDYSDLLEDPSIDEEFRDILRDNKKKAAKNVNDASELVASLDRYRVLRVAYEASKSIVDKLKDSKADPEEIINYMAGMVSEARSRENLQDKILNLGHDGNAYDLIDKVLDPTTEMLHKTGYHEFDNRNGGVPTEGVWILAGTTSGGKSVLRMNIMEYMYFNNNLDCLTVSLEMNAEKESRRLAASRSRVPLWKIAKGMLKEKDREEIKSAWKTFYRHGKKNKCRYSLFCPTRGLTIQQLLMLIKPFKYKVVAIDYVSLLEGVDEKDQWKMLSSIVRQCKIFSSENKCLVILLAQLDSDDDRIRYSKGMLEHADACWTWNYSRPEQRELKEIPIQQRKARDQELFPFPLKEEFEIMRVSNPDNVEQEAERGPPSNNESDDGDDNKRKTKKSKSSYDEDDIDPDEESSSKKKGKSKKKRRESEDEDEESQVQFVVD